MSDKALINQPKMNFFQRRRKKITRRRINKKNYSNLPDYLKNDTEVIDKMIEKDISAIEVLPDNLATEYIKKNPSIIATNFSRVNGLMQHYVEIEPELFKSLPKNVKLEMIFIDEKYEFLKELDENTQYRVLNSSPIIQIPVLKQKAKSIKFSCGKIINEEEHPDNHVLVYLKINSYYFANKLNYFSTDVIYNVVRSNYEIAKRFYYEKLPIDVQLNIACMDNRLLEEMEDETIYRFVNQNPVILSNVSKKIRDKIIEQNPMLKKTVTKYYEAELGKKNYLEKASLEKILMDCTQSNKGIKGFYSGDFPYDLYLDKQYDTLWKLVKVMPDVLKMTLYQHAVIKNKIGVAGLHVIFQSLRENVKKPNIINALKKSKFFGYKESNRDFYYNYNEVESSKFDDIINILKVLSDNKALERCDEETIIQFIKNPSMSVLKDIIKQTYGEKALNILNSRPALELKDIPNLKIFDENIINNFGESETHNMLSYDCFSKIALAYFANNPQEIIQFQRFKRLVNGIFENNVSGKDQEYKAFFRFHNILSKINIEEMTPNEVEALKLAICDMDNLDTKMIPLDNINDLQHYKKARDNLYIEALEKTTDINLVKEIISKKLFGMKYYEYKEKFSPDKLTLFSLFQEYNIENILEDKRTYERGVFTEEEIEFLKIVKSIIKGKNIEELKNTFYILNNKKDFLNPESFRKMKNKIPLQYTEELVSQLFKYENIDKEKCTEEKGIMIDTNKDGVPIVKLKGLEFKMMIHAMSNKSGLSIPSHYSEKDLWEDFESGCSTVSASLICSGMLDNAQPDDETPIFGFSSIDPENIIGMSHMDAQVEHMEKAITPESSYYQFGMNYPEELIRKTAAQILGIITKDLKHPYNEIFFYRREQNEDKVSSENKGGRIMPDYIVVFGEHNQKHIQLAKEFGKNGRPLPIIEIHREYYPDRKLALAKKRDSKHKINDNEDVDRV